MTVRTANVGIRHTQASNVSIMGRFTDATGIGVGTFFVAVTSGLTGSTVGTGGVDTSSGRVHKPESFAETTATGTHHVGIGAVAVGRAFVGSAGTRGAEMESSIADAASAKTDFVGVARRTIGCLVACVQNASTGGVGGESGFADAVSGGAFFVGVGRFADGVGCAFILDTDTGYAGVITGFADTASGRAFFVGVCGLAFGRRGALESQA